MISILQCPQSGHCPDPFDELGTTLYLGPYHPQFPTFPTPQDQPQQNFTVTVPTYLEANYKAQLAVTHLTLIGVSGNLGFAFSRRGPLTRDLFFRPGRSHILRSRT